MSESPVLPSAHPLAGRLRLFSATAAVAVSLLGGVVLVGWALDIPVLTSLSPSWVSMKPNTALGFLLAGVALSASQEGRGARARTLALVASAVMAAIGVATLAEYLLGLDLGIDQLLFSEPPGTIGTFMPGRMALTSAVCLTILAASIPMVTRSKTDRLQGHEIGGTAVAAIAGQALLSYLLGADFSIGAGQYSRMAVHTGVAFVLLGAGLVCIRPLQGWAGVQNALGVGGRMARRLVPAVALVPLVGELVCSAGVEAGWFDHAVGASLQAVLTIVVSAAIVTVFARSVARGEVAVAQVSVALHTSERRLRAILDGIGDGVIAVDASGRVEAMNPVAEALTGWKSEDARGRSLADVFVIVHEVTRLPLGRPVDKVLGEGVVAGSADLALLLARDGAERPIRESAAPIRDHAGQISGAVLVIHDATAERMAQVALAYRSGLLESMEDAVISTAPDGTIRTWSPGAERAYGWAEGTALGQSVLTLLRLESQPGYPVDLAGLTASAGSGPLPSLCRNRAGDTREVEMTVARVVDPTGRVSGYVFVHRDVTERNRLQNKLTVSERMASIGSVAAGVAHEINNPLAYVETNLTFATDALRKALARPGAERHPLSEALSAVVEAQQGSQRVSSIVRDLKTFSRGGDERDSVCDVRRALDVAITLATNEMRHRARLVRDYEPLPPVRAVESRLGQVFLNLLVNAAHAIPAGNAAGNEILVRTRLTPDGRVLVQVKDSGAGMTPEVKKRAFDPFYTTKEVGAGTGLGLSICHGIVSSLGGEIHLESAPGEGTTASVLLPAVATASPTVEPPTARPTVEPAPEAAASPAVAPASADARGRILIVDDEPLIGRALSRMLGGRHEVATDTSAQDVIRRIEGGQRFDLVLCDLMMPTMSGMELYARLETIAPEQADRMVFMTGGAFTAEASAFLEAFPGRRLDKPFDPLAIREVLRLFLGRPPDGAGGALAVPAN